MNLPSQNTPSESAGGINAKVVVGAVAALLLIIFILQNRDRVRIEFLVFSFTAPLWLILAVVAVLGALLDDFVINAVRKARGKDG